MAGILTRLRIAQSIHNDISRRRSKTGAPVCDRRISPLIERHTSKWPSLTYVAMNKIAQRYLHGYIWIAGYASMLKSMKSVIV